MKLLISLFLFFPAICFSQGKSNLDSIIIKFLQSQPNTSPPSLIIEKHGKYQTIIRNYFWNPNEPITADSIKITTYIFGSSSSHSPRYLLINISSNKKQQYKIIDDLKVEDGINSLLKYLGPYKLSNSQKAQLLNQLTFSYY